MRFLWSGIIFLCGSLLLMAGCGNQAREAQPMNAEQATVLSQNFTIAGSGSNLAVTTKLAEAYKAKTGIDIQMPTSIGSGGAINAVQAGSLELGMISRPLTAEERGAGLQELPYTRVAVAFAANASAPDTNLSTTEVIEILKGTKTTWSDGTKIFVHVREPKDSSNLILYDLMPAYNDTLFNAYQNKRWEVLYRDSDMAAALANTKGAFGLITSADAVVNKPQIKVLSLDGVEPTVGNIHSGKYKAVKELSFVCKGKQSDRVASFLAFVYSPEAQRLLNEWGGFPIER